MSLASPDGSANNPFSVSNTLGSAVAITPSDTVTVAAGRQFFVSCTVAGNVKVGFPDASTLSFAVIVGVTLLPWRVTQVFVTGTTATATYANLT